MSKHFDHEVGDLLGIVDAAVFSLPETGVGEAWEVLHNAAQSGLLMILDLVFLEKTADGVRRLADEEITNLGAEGVSAFESGLIDDEDLAVSAQNLLEGEKAVVVLKEDLSFYHVVEAFESEGAELVADVVVLIDDLEDALEGGE